MQITTSLPSSIPAYSSPATTSAASTPEDFLTPGDLQMIEYISGTTTLSAAEENLYAKAMAVSLGTKREHGYVQGDVSKFYFWSQLTVSDAKTIETMTGTSTIIDAVRKGDTGVNNLIWEITFDREHGGLEGDLSVSYLQGIIDRETEQIRTAVEHGDPAPSAIIPSVPFDTLQRAISYLKENNGTSSTAISA